VQWHLQASGMSSGLTIRRDRAYGAALMLHTGILSALERRTPGTGRGVSHPSPCGAIQRRWKHTRTCFGSALRVRREMHRPSWSWCVLSSVPAHLPVSHVQIIASSENLFLLAYLPERDALGCDCHPSARAPGRM